jgi:hypothetical protein
MAGFFSLVEKIKRSQPSAAPTGIQVGAAEGCDLLIFTIHSTTGQTGHANFVVFTCIPEKAKPRLRLHWTYR